MNTKDKIKFNDAEDEVLIAKMLSKYYPYWPVFLVFIILSTAGSFLYIKYSAPTYEATASIIIKDEKKGNEESKLLESLNMMNSKKIIENEIEVLKSSPIIEMVVKNLHLYAPLYVKGEVIDHTGYMKSPLIIESNDPYMIKDVSEKIYFSFNRETNEVWIGNQNTGNPGKWIKTKYGIIRFKLNPRSTDIIEDQGEYFFVLKSIHNASENVTENLKISSSNKLSSIINLEYKDKSHKLCEDVLNEMLYSYNELAVSEKNMTAKKTLAFIEDRLNVVGSDLESIEKKIQQYKSTTGAVDIGTQGQLFLENVSTNDQRLSEINYQLSLINQIEKQISIQDNISGALPSTIGSVDPTLSQLLNNLVNAELEKEKLRKTVAENNPMLVSLSDQINKIKQNIKNSISSQRNSLEASKLNLYETNKNYNTLLHRIPSKERELLEISREQSIKSGIYSFLLQKREESKLSYASTISDNRVINKAKALDNPVSPNKMIVLSAAMLFAMIIPVSFIGARETFSSTVLYRKDIESATSIPIIGEISYNKKNNQQAIEVGKRSLLSEEVRKIRHSLSYIGIDAEHKKILITSGISGEGKSFFAANLAISCSMTGKRVVLIDLDLHNSSLTRIFSGVPNTGISDYLTGQIDEERIINKVNKYENLYFIPPGEITEDPSELIENGRINKLFTHLENKFDLIIVDTAPIGLVTDAHVLSPLCDTTIYMVRHTYSPKNLLKRFDQNNEITPLKNPAIIFNGIKNRGFTTNNYGYGYGYNSYYGGNKKKRESVSSI
jgi:capsular exopolysaccharide synthesis family protein